MAGEKRFDLPLVVVHADDVMAHVGETGTGDQAYVSRTYNSYIHTKSRLPKRFRYGGSKFCPGLISGAREACSGTQRTALLGRTFTGKPNWGRSFRVRASESVTLVFPLPLLRDSRLRVA